MLSRGTSEPTVLLPSQRKKLSFGGLQDSQPCTSMFDSRERFPRKAGWGQAPVLTLLQSSRCRVTFPEPCLSYSGSITLLSDAQRAALSFCTPLHLGRLHGSQIQSC